MHDFREFRQGVQCTAPTGFGFTGSFGAVCNPGASELLLSCSAAFSAPRSAVETPGGRAMRASPRMQDEAEMRCLLACRSSGFL
jgi:hypothetical protein